MTDRAYKTWHSNLAAKVDEIRQLGMNYATTKEDRLSKGTPKQDFESLEQKIENRLEGLSSMYGPNQVPGNLKAIRQAFRHLKNELRNPTRLQTFFEALQNLPRIVSEAGSPPIDSFDKIFESYKSDEKLEELAAELLKTLEELLEVADDNLSASICRDLDQIVNGLKNRKNQSMHETNVWVDWGIKICLTIAEAGVGFPGLNLAYEGIKLGRATKIKMMKCHEDAQLNFAKTKNMRKVEKVILDLPQNITDEEIEIRLKESTK